MDRKELHTRLLKAREEQERYSRDLNSRLERATADHEAAIARARELAGRIAHIRREVQEHSQLSGREIERLREQLRASAPRVLSEFEEALERRWSELRAAAGSPSLANQAAALHEARDWIRHAMTDGAVDEAAVFARWSELRRDVPAVRGPDQVDVQAEIAA